MSRHRDIRNMDYSEDYDGYDDIYGHSMDDDYYISPSHRQFMFNRENSRDQAKIGEYIQTEQDIQEEDESESTQELSDLEKAKLESCLEQIKTTLGPVNISRNELVNIIISQNFNVEKATDAILNLKDLTSDRKEKDVRKVPTKFFVPKLNGLNENTQSPFKTPKFNIPTLSSNNLPPKFVIPKLISDNKTVNFTIPQIDNYIPKQNLESVRFNNLSDLVSNHLSKSLQKKLTVDATSSQIDKAAEGIQNLNVTENKTSKDYQIDLSVALKLTPSGHNISKSKTELKEEKFEIPFIDCDINLQTKNILNCTFDIKDILKLCVQNVKPVSNFGRVLCLKFRRRGQRRHRIIFQDKIISSKITRFNFSSPSPDDNIMKHLNK